MPGTPNLLKEMATLKVDLPNDDERPNPSFVDEVLPGFKRTVQARRAIRKFTGAPIPQDVMRDCLRDAMLAPTSSNLQTFELYWIREDKTKSKVAACCLDQPATNTAGDLIVAVSRIDLWRERLSELVQIMTRDGERSLTEPIGEYYNKIIPMLMRTDRLGFWNLIRRITFFYKGLRGPFIRVPVSQADHRIYGHIQAALAAQTLMLSLSAHGYESCPIGGFDKKRLGKILDLPRTAEVTMVIAAGIGEPEGLFSPRIRLPYENLIKEV